MFRFTIRDVLWLTVVIGIGLAWGAFYWRTERENDVFNWTLNELADTREEVLRLRKTVADMKAERQSSATLIDSRPENRSASRED